MMGIRSSDDDDFKFPHEVEEEGKQAEEEVKGEQGDDVEVEVVDDTPPRDRGRKPLEKPVAEPTDDELAGYSEGVKKRIKELTHARHDERRKAEALQRERDEALRVAQTLMNRTKAVETQFTAGAQQFAAVNKAAAEAEVVAAKQKLKQAKEAYDTDAELAAIEELQKALIKVKEAENFRAPTFQPIEEVVQIPQTSEDTSDNLDPKTAAWKSANSWWFGQDGYEDVSHFALGLHQKLVASGIDPRTDRYFEQVDKNLRQRFPDVFKDEGNEEEQPPPRTTQRKPPVVVGASRAAAGGRKVQLTQSQLRLAEKLGITPQQYAAELVKQEKSNA